MKNEIIKYAKAIHHTVPFCVRRIYAPGINVFRLIRSFYLRLYYFEGKEYSSGLQLKVAYLGLDERILNYWTGRLFSQKNQNDIKKTIPVWKAYSYLKNNTDKYDLVIVEVNRLTRRFIRSDIGFLLPRWLEMKLNVMHSIKIISKGDIARRIRKNSLTVEKRRSPEDFKLFYERMYKPYISKRYKDSAVISDFKYFNNIFRKKGTQMYFIIKENEPVAGSIDELRGNTVRMCGIGILDGREDLKGMGIIGALYYFQIVEYFKRNIKFIHLGGTSPILTDGLTKFKLSIGAEADDLKQFGELFLWLTPLVDSPAVRSILQSNPFISILENRLHRNIFLTNEYEIDTNKLNAYLEHTKCNNIASTRIHCFNNAEIVSDIIKKTGQRDVEVAKFEF